MPVIATHRRIRLEDKFSLKLSWPAKCVSHELGIRLRPYFQNQTTTTTTKVEVNKIVLLHTYGDIFLEPK